MNVTVVYNEFNESHVTVLVDSKCKIIWVSIMQKLAVTIGCCHF